MSLYKSVSLLLSGLVLCSAHATSVLGTPGCGPTIQEVSAARPQAPAAIAGLVVDASGAALPGAIVHLRGSSNALEATAKTGNDGRFLFGGLRPGTYTLEVEQPGFASKTIPVSLGNGQLFLRLALSLTVNDSVEVHGRADDLVGFADSATQGTVGPGEIGSRPILRAGEILEAVPGLIVTQHAGGGKANQYFLRGFNLDHGTDFAISLDGMPLNLPSHAHGEGYADMNTVIPEFVARLNFQKGPYYADVGNYGSAGSAQLEFFKTLPGNFLQVEGGMYGFGRAVFGVSRKLGPGSLLLGGEAFHDDGPWAHPDNYYKFNGLLTYSQGSETSNVSLTARGYHGSWHSSDQIPVSAVAVVGFFGTLNPTDGGRSQRYSLQGQWHHAGNDSITEIRGYGFYYDLNLFSDFTYFLTDPNRGDQFEQKDRRWVAGADLHHAIFGRLFGRRVQNTLGLQLRNDWIHNGLFQSENRIRVDKVDAATGTILPATTQADRFSDTQLGVYAENRIQWSEHFRSVLGLRGDVQHFAVTSLVTSANSGTASKVLPSPKAGLIFGPWKQTEVYTQAGFSFHSNDGRGATQTVEPISADNPLPKTPATPVPALIPTKGGEFGIRTTAIPHLQTTVSVWYLHSASELQQDGDTGETIPSQQPSERYGVEWANFYTPLLHLSFDFDLANSKALFTAADPSDAAPNSPGGKRVSEAVGSVLSSGITLKDVHRISSSLRLRYFGPRDLTSDGLFRSRSTMLLNAEGSYHIGESWTLSGEFLNLLNRHDHDIDYAYTAQTTPSAAPAFTNVFHPVEPFQVRFALRKSF